MGGKTDLEQSSNQGLNSEALLQQSPPGDANWDGHCTGVALQE